jgi:hypothetical protein
MMSEPSMSNFTIGRLVALTAMVVWCSQVAAEVVLFEHDGYAGRRVATNDAIRGLQQHGFNDLASSLVVRGGRWEFCVDAEFRGRCVTLDPGEYKSLRQFGLNDQLSSLRLAGGQGGGRDDDRSDVVIFRDDNFSGESHAVDGAVANLKGFRFNDVASSLVILRGKWELCADADYRGNCVILDRGRYPSLRELGIDDQVSSIRRLRGTDTGFPRDDRGDVVVFHDDNFHGESRSIDRAVANFIAISFNDTVSSIVIRRGSWEFCVDADYRGRCLVLERGEYPSLRTFGLNDQLSSVRRVDDPRRR